MTKNITLAIDQDLLDKVRVLAAIRRTSVNEMVRQFLEREVQRETTQASRAEIWARIFEGADRGGETRAGQQADGRIADRETPNGEVLRERRLF